MQNPFLNYLISDNNDISEYKVDPLVFDDFPERDLYMEYLNYSKPLQTELQDKPVIEDIILDPELVKHKEEKSLTNETNLPKAKAGSERLLLIDEMKKQGFSDEEINYYDKLAGRESSWKSTAKATGKHKSGKSYTARGYFQFLDTTARELGYDPENMSMADLVAAIKKFNDRNWKYLEKYMPQAEKMGYTKWSLLGGAHLGGVGGVRAFLQNNQNRSDKFGTSVKKYMEHFR